MLNHLRDLMKHTSGLDVEVLRVTGDQGAVNVSGINDNKSLIIKGDFVGDIAELEGVCGLGRLEWLSGFANAYTETSDTVTVIRKNRTFRVEQKDDNGDTVFDENGEAVYAEITEDVIEEFVFNRPTPKMRNTYRVMDKRMIPQQYQPAGLNWDIEIKPTKQAIDMLAQQNSFDIEENFGVRLEDGELYFNVGDSGTEGEIEFARNVTGSFSKSWVWKLAPTLTILKFSDNAECLMSFSEQGALKISLNTGLAKYEYIMPAKPR